MAQRRYNRRARPARVRHSRKQLTELALQTAGLEKAAQLLAGIRGEEEQEREQA